MPCRRGALCSPLVETHWKLHATFDFGRYVQHDVYRRVESHFAKVLADAQQVVIAACACLWIEYRDARVAVDDPDGLQDARP